MRRRERERDCISEAQRGQSGWQYNVWCFMAIHALGACRAYIIKVFTDISKLNLNANVSVEVPPPSHHPLV